MLFVVQLPAQLGPVFFYVFLLPTKKPRQRRSFCREEHIQESVLVSTLKRRSALLTHMQTKGRNSVVSPCLAALSTGTVTVGAQRRYGITCSRIGALLAMRVVRRRVVREAGKGGGAIGGIGVPSRLKPELWPWLFASASSRFTGSW